MADLIKPTRAASLSHQVADELRSRITSGEWPVGTKIPAEPELTRSLGVSRSTIREAVRSLAHVRMLETRAGDGTYVRSNSALEFPLLDRIAHAEVRDVLEIRIMLEERTARLAAERCTPADAEELRALLADTETAAAEADSIADLQPAGLALYRVMGRITGNPLLAELYRHVSSASFGDLTAAPVSETYLARWREGLADLVEAICANDPARAEQVMRRLQSDALDELG